MLAFRSQEEIKSIWESLTNEGKEIPKLEHLEATILTMEKAYDKRFKKLTLGLEEMFIVSKTNCLEIEKLR